MHRQLGNAIAHLTSPANSTPGGLMPSRYGIRHPIEDHTSVDEEFWRWGGIMRRRYCARTWAWKNVYEGFDHSSFNMSVSEQVHFYRSLWNRVSHWFRPTNRYEQEDDSGANGGGSRCDIYGEKESDLIFSLYFCLQTTTLYTFLCIQAVPSASSPAWASSACLRLSTGSSSLLQGNSGGKRRPEFKNKLYKIAQLIRRGEN